MQPRSAWVALHRPFRTETTSRAPLRCVRRRGGPVRRRARSRVRSGRARFPDRRRPGRALGGRATCSCTAMSSGPGSTPSSSRSARRTRSQWRSASVPRPTAYDARISAAAAGSSGCSSVSSVSRLSVEPRRRHGSWPRPTRGPPPRVPGAGSGGCAQSSSAALSLVASGGVRGAHLGGRRLAPDPVDEVDPVFRSPQRKRDVFRWQPRGNPFTARERNRKSRYPVGG